MTRETWEGECEGQMEEEDKQVMHGKERNGYGQDIGQRKNTIATEHQEENRSAQKFSSPKNARKR